MTKHTGGLWEDHEWELHENCEFTLWNQRGLCPHAKCVRIEKITRADGSTVKRPVYVVPRAVIAWNEGGFNTTAVCADCVLAALSETDQKEIVSD